MIYFISYLAFMLFIVDPFIVFIFYKINPQNAWYSDNYKSHFILKIYRYCFRFLFRLISKHN